MEMLDQLRTRYWDDNEVRELLALWGDERVQRELDGTRRDNQVFIRLSDSLRCKGIYRSPAQVREKIKILKREYRVCLNVLHDNGRLPAKYKYFEYMRAILGGPTSGTSGEPPDASPNRCEPEVIIDQVPHSEALLIPKSEPRHHHHQNGRVDSPDNSERSEDHLLYGGGGMEFAAPPRIKHNDDATVIVLDRFLAFLKESNDRFYDLEEKRMRHERELEEMRQQRETNMFERLYQMAVRAAGRVEKDDEQEHSDAETPAPKRKRRCRCRASGKTQNKAVQTCD